MAENSAIEWTRHSFNIRWGCVKVSAGCDNCYAETFDKRVGGAHWGPHAPRRMMSDAYWRAPLKWDATALKAGERHRVFCSSMADTFEKVDDGQLERLWHLIRQTPNLDWLLLTKRPQNIAKMLPDDWGDGYPNVWLGTTVEHQAEADRRIPHLLAAPARVRFLSCEPLLGFVDLTRIKALPGFGGEDGWHTDVLTSSHFQVDDMGREHSGDGPIDDKIDWVICGGESGPNARPMHPDWARSLRDQCVAAGVPFFFKQWGEWVGSVTWAPDCIFLDRDGRQLKFEADFQRARDAEKFPVEFMHKRGKKRAGRLLDRLTWDQFPQVEG